MTSAVQIKYEDEETGSSLEVNNIEVTFPNFIEFLNNNKTKIFHTKICEDHKIKSKFEIKTIFLGVNNDLLELYYLSHVPAFMKLCLLFKKCRWHVYTFLSTEYQNILPHEWIPICTLSKYQILNNQDDFIVYNKFWFKLTFTFNTNTSLHTTEIFESSLNKDLEHLRTSELYFDTTMKSIEGTDYKVHKAIISTRSAVLKAHYDHDTEECSNNIIQTQFPDNILQEIIKYLYSNYCPKLNEMPKELLAAADYYQLNELKSFCGNVLHRTLSFENAIEVLILADMHSVDHLKQVTMEFIKDSPFKFIKNTNGWDKMTNNLKTELYEYIIVSNGNNEFEYFLYTE